MIEIEAGRAETKWNKCQFDNKFFNSDIQLLLELHVTNLT